MADSLPIGVLISGAGTTLRNLLGERDAGRLPVAFTRVVSSRSTAGGLAFAADAGIASRVVRRRDFADPASHSATVFETFRAAGTRLVVMAGYVEHLLIPADFENRVVNIHPSLIPAFCGKGFFGRRVHERVLAYGAKISGCTVHFVDNEYDHGPIILQEPVTVSDDDTPDSLAARVFAAECVALPEALRWIAADRLSVVGRRVVRRAASPPA